MTIAQKLEQKGMEKGMEIGQQRGEREASLKIARSMLSNGLDSATVMKMTGLSEMDVQQICH